MSSSRRRTFVPVFIALCGLTAACSRTPQTGPERVAVLPFENLTSDPSLAWMSRALANVVAVRASAHEAPSVRDAQMMRASAIVQGYFVREGSGVRIHARGMTRTLTAAGDPSRVIELAGELARQMGRQPREYTTSNPNALQALFQGDPEKAIALDPQYGNAHLQRLQKIGRDQQALEAAQKARYTASDQARLDLIAAQTPESRIAALKRVAETSLADPALWRTLAELQMQSKFYTEAAQSYGRVLEVMPGDETSLNSRGYALMYAGDFAGAVQSLQQYAKVAADSANPLDSLAEVHFYFGKYAEAARLFQEAHQKDPRQIGGFELFRAALATHLAGDTAKADQMMNRFLAERAKSGDSFAELRRSLWMRLTGRKLDSKPEGAIGEAAASLIALYDGDRARARALAESARKSAALPQAVSLASTALLLAESSASADMWRSRIASVLPRPEQAAGARQLLGYALLLDRRFADAEPVWREIYESTPGLLANEARMGLAWARQKPVEGFLPPSTLEPTLPLLLHLRALEKR